jgi:hypothetical protein
MSVTLAQKPTPDEQQPYHELLDRVTLDTTDEDEDDTGPEDVFDHVAFEHPDVCSNCFVRVRVDGVTAAEAVDGTDDIDKGHTTRPLDGEPGHPHSARRAYPHRTTCGACGSVGCGALDETLSTQQAVARIPDLAAVLSRHGFRFDRDELYRTVRYCKQDPDRASMDTEIYRQAVRRAIQSAWGTL